MICEQEKRLNLLLFALNSLPRLQANSVLDRNIFHHRVLKSREYYSFGHRMGWRAGLYFGIGSSDRLPLTHLNTIWLGFHWALNSLWLPWLWTSTFKPNAMSLLYIKKERSLITKKYYIKLAHWELNMQNQSNEITCLWLQEPSSFLRRFNANLTRSCFSPIIFWQIFELCFFFSAALFCLDSFYFVIFVDIE